jgi:predicted transcriptional regulator
MGAALGTLTEVRELKSEIAGLRTDLKRFIERANQQHVDAVLCDIRKNYAGVMTDHQVETAKNDLAAHMVGDCTMREKCYELFMDFLQKTSRHIRDGAISDDVVRAYRKQMKAMRKKGPFETCDTCFSEVHRLFEKQIDLMQSLGIYEKNAGKTAGLEELDDAVVVQSILEPVANLQRFQILKSLATQTRTFSDISQMTGLRGGNLLFHIRKLTESNMILQRHERGDYVITEKGFATLQAVTELSRMV